MTIIIFIIILLVLVIIHEGGHFFAAKASRVRVDEFAFGFPPRLWSKKKGETTYAINALPLGGYVKIHGENGEDENGDKRSFVNKHPLTKIFILIAGVLMNLILAYMLVTLSVYLNTDIPVNRDSQDYQQLMNEGRIKSESAMIVNIVKNSPAAMSPLKVGYKITKITANQENLSGKVISTKEINIKESDEEIVKDISNYINGDTIYNDSITFTFLDKNKDSASTTIAGVYNIDGEENKKMIGIALTKVAEARLSLIDTIKYGFERTTQYIELTIIGFKDLIVHLIKTGKVGADIAGPVGIVSAVGQARGLGFDYLLTFTAVLSISLAIFNILPIPALDGGRILFVLIEWITRKKMSVKWQNILNTAGFLLLILLMILVTIKDVLKLF